QDPARTVTIKFICGCGKHLKARDEMAARRSLCPRCSSPVGVPSLNSGQMAGSAPLTPLERLRLARNRKPLPVEVPSSQPEGPPPAVTQTTEARVPRPVDGQGPARSSSPRGAGEGIWRRCLLSPFRAWSLWLPLALVLTLLSVLLAATVAWIEPDLLALPDGSPLGISHLVSLLLLLTVVALVWSFLEGVLALAMAGEGPAGLTPRSLWRT